ncbi:MAG: DUF1273 family protein [Christensenellaceae bacterium]|nr:DUF1273 family protein [Christensenellaceae bacterium]
MRGEVCTIKKQTVCFIGHSSIPLEISDYLASKISTAVKELVLKGFTDFVVGCAPGFDALAAQEVLSLKRDYPQVKLRIVLPYRIRQFNWSWNDYEFHVSILNVADSVEYISNRPTRNCMRKRNRRIVGMSSVCVCYLNQNTGWTADSVEYASTKHLKIVNIENKLAMYSQLSNIEPR